MATDGPTPPHGAPPTPEPAPASARPFVSVPSPAENVPPRRRFLGLLPVPHWRLGAWQPFTWRGAAAFSTARFSRLFVVQLLAALVVAGALVWFLDHTWFPTIHEAVRQLPDTGRIESQQLSTPRTSPEPLVENRWLALFVDAEEAGTPTPGSDLRIEFKKRRVDLCSLPGCFSVPYPAGYVLEFNRPELESWWEAAEPAVYVGTVLLTVAFLFVTWCALATVCCPWVRLLAFFKDRSLTLGGSWRVSAAALVPAALFVALAVVLYGLGLIDLIRLATAWAIHLPLGVVWLFMAVLRLPAVAGRAPGGGRNPFGHDEPAVARKRKRRNPFGGASAGPRTVDPAPSPVASAPALQSRKPRGPFDPA